MRKALSVSALGHFNIDVSKIEIPAIGYYKLVLPDGSNTTFKDYENDGFEVPERTQH